MRNVRRRDTPAEIALRQELHRRGLRYRVDARPLKDVPRRADVSTGESIGRAVFEVSGRVHCGVRPAPGAGFDTFDLRRLRDCFVRVRGGTAPADDDVQGWEASLRNVELMTDAPGHPVAMVDGQLPFGRKEPDSIRA